MMRILPLIAGILFTSNAVAQPVTAIIGSMQQAHGGMRQWKKVHTIYFNHHIVFGSDSSRQWWISRETTEQTTMRFYETRPAENAAIVFNGHSTWSVNWRQSNPPAMLVNNHLLQQVLPFVAGHPLVIAQTEPGRKLPGNDSVLFMVVKLTFRKEAGFDTAKYYRIFIHPVTRRMAGWEYNITHSLQLKKMDLPEGTAAYGPFINKIHSYTRAAGLLLPEKYDTYHPRGHISGNHLVLDYKINGPFDNSMMRMPAGAVADSTLNRYLLKLN